MSTEHIQADGKKIPTKSISLPKARNTLLALNKLDYVSLLECRKLESGVEIIVFETEVELGQHIVNDIQSVERIAVQFDPDDNQFPEVLALRQDFPQVSHLNLRLHEIPRSLCLFDEPYEDIKLSWTASAFVERIRTWLARTAKGTLHLDDQPLEPILPHGLIDIILPEKFYNESQLPEAVEIKRIIQRNGDIYTVILGTADQFNFLEQELNFITFTFHTAAVCHGIIRRQPQTLSDLHALLAPGYNLLGKIRDRLNTVKKCHYDWLDREPLLLLRLPKTRSQEGPVESIEYRAFRVAESCKTVGQQIGLWDLNDEEIGLLLEPDTTQCGENVLVEILNPYVAFSKRRAKLYAGLQLECDPKITVIGLGALGSQVFLNLIRIGFGKWTIVDEDRLMPHNLERHALTSAWIGYNKAEALAAESNAMLNETDQIRHISADVLSGSNSEKIENALSEAYQESDILLDISTSVPVARHLTHDVDSRARRISMFLNPTATDLVVLCEDKTREYTLDTLEMQYYRLVLQTPKLSEHLRVSSSRTRYANSCRDLSSKIPQDLVALHAATASRVFRSKIEGSNSFISVWRTDPSRFELSRFDAEVAKPTRLKIGKWTIVVDEFLMGKLSETRLKKLPNETGGVLLGFFDMQRNLCYIVDTILSPPDSTEWPTVYIRGCKDLRKNVADVGDRTAGMIEYVGEWHSHPAGCPPYPSDDDKKAFQWLDKHMRPEGYPALMSIAGDNKIEFYIESMC